MPAKFLGTTSLGPGEKIEHSRPHDYDRRGNDHHDAALDVRLAKLRAGGQQLVRRPDGHIVTLDAHVKLKPGFVRLNPSEIDQTAEGPSERDTLHDQIEAGSVMYVPPRREDS